MLSLSLVLLHQLPLLSFLLFLRGLLRPPVVVPSAPSGIPSAPMFSSVPSSLPLPQSLPSFAAPSSTIPPSGSLGFGASVAVPVAAPAGPPVESRSFFRPFAVSDASAVLGGCVCSSGVCLRSAWLHIRSACLVACPLGSSAWCSSAASATSGAGGPPPAAAFAFTSEDPYDPGFLDSASRDPEVPLPPTVPDSVCAEIRKIYAYVVDLFPQAAGSLRMLFLLVPCLKSSSPCPRLRTNRSFSSGSRGCALLLRMRILVWRSVGPSLACSCLVRLSMWLRGTFCLVWRFLSMFERPLRPSLQLGLSVREAVALEASCRSHSEALSFVVAAFGIAGVCSVANAALFNTLVTLLSKCLAHQASLSASQTAFIGLKCRQFYLSHLLAYFSDINKLAMLASLLVCTDLLFSEADVARLLADTQMSSSLRSQQALVDVASRSTGARRRRFSPSRSPARSSPSRCCRRDSGSPSHQN